jgi:hypothetical protein
MPLQGPITLIPDSVLRQVIEQTREADWTGVLSDCMMVCSKWRVRQAYIREDRMLTTVKRQDIAEPILYSNLSLRLPSTRTAALARTIEDAVDATSNPRYLSKHIRELHVRCEFEDGIESTAEADLLVMLWGASNLRTLDTDNGFALPIVLVASRICSSTLQRLDIGICEETVIAVKYLHHFPALHTLAINATVFPETRGTLRSLIPRPWTLPNLRILTVQGASAPAWLLAEYFCQGYFPVLKELQLHMDWRGAECGTQCVAGLSCLPSLIKISIRPRGLQCKSVLPGIHCPLLSVTTCLEPKDVFFLPTTLQTLRLDENASRTFLHTDMCSMLNQLAKHHPPSLKVVSFTSFARCWTSSGPRWTTAELRKEFLYKQAELIHCARELLKVGIQLRDAHSKTFMDN